MKVDDGVGVLLLLDNHDRMSVGKYFEYRTSRYSVNFNRSRAASVFTAFKLDTALVLARGLHEVANFCLLNTMFRSFHTNGFRQISEWYADVLHCRNPTTF
jgi:hypothetical protein